MTKASEKLQLLLSRKYEYQVLNQYESTFEGDRWLSQKERIEAMRKLVTGDWADLYPDGTDMPGAPLIENSAKSSLRDISGLAAESQPGINFVPEGEKKDDYVAAQVREAIADTYWQAGNGRRIERRLYMDLIGAGFAVGAVTKNPDSDVPYPVTTRLKPDRCWPDVFNGTLQNLLYNERIKLRQASALYPDLITEAIVPAWSDEDCQLIDYYDNMNVVKGIIFTKGGKLNKRDRDSSIVILEEWEHKLGRVPVAFVQLDSVDEAFRGLLDQTAPGLLSRNRVFQYLMDYIYDMVHSPYEEKNVRNWDELPGPDTVYHHDPSATESFLRRVQPAAPAAAVFGIAQYMDSQTSGETVQPPSRQGDVRQSIASASFVSATQGRLTTVVRDLHDLMLDFRHQQTQISLLIDQKHMDEKKPLYRPVGKKTTYLPSKDIGDWLHFKVTFGVAAGIDPVAADQRLLQAQGARWISKETARDNLSYMDDPTVEQDKIDREDANDAFKQRLLTDPRMPLSVVARVSQLMADGISLVDAATEVLPELQQADQAQAAAGQAGQPGTANQPSPTGVPGQEGLAAGAVPNEAGVASQGTAPGQPGPTPGALALPSNPLVQQFIGTGR